MQEWGQVYRKDLDIQGALQVAAPEAWRAQRESEGWWGTGVGQVGGVVRT